MVGWDWMVDRKYVVGALIRAPSLLNNIFVKIFNMTTAKDKITSRTLTTRARMLQRKKTSTTQSNIIASPVMNNLNLSTFMMMMIMMMMMIKLKMMMIMMVS